MINCRYNKKEYKINSLYSNNISKAYTLNTKYTNPYIIFICPVKGAGGCSCDIFKDDREL